MAAPGGSLEAGAEQEIVGKEPNEFKHQLSKAEQHFDEYLQTLRVSVEDGSERCMVGRRARDVSGRWIYVCFPCGAVCSGENVLQVHISGNKHRIKTSMNIIWPVSIFNYFPTKKKKIDSTPVVMTTAPENTIVQDKSNRILNEYHLKYETYRSVDCHLQESLDNLKAPILGVEYLIEHAPEQETYSPSYMCTLCMKQGQTRTIINHLTSYWHRHTFLVRHFPKACGKLHPYFRDMRYRNECAYILNMLSQRIEDKYGRKRPVNIDKEEYERDKDHVHQWVAQDHHFSEKDGATFEEVINEELLESLINARDAQVDKDEKNLQDSSAVESSNIKIGQNRMADFVAPFTDVSGERDKQQNKGPFSKDRYEPYNQRTNTKSVKTKQLEQKNAWKQKMAEEMCIAREESAKQTLAYHMKNPEKHPSYPEEWRKFWNKRYKELKAEGKDPAKHDFKPEWIVFWTARMKEMHDEELRVHVHEIYQKMGMIPVNENQDLNDEQEQQKASSSVPSSEEQKSEASAVRQRSPLDHRRAPDRRASSDRRRSPPDRRRASPDRRRASPDRRRSSPDRRRPPPDHRRPYVDRRRSPSDRRRSPPDRRRSPPDHRRPFVDRRRPSPDRRRWTPDRRRLSTDQRREPHDYRKTSLDRHGEFPNRRRESPDRHRRTPDRRRTPPDYHRTYTDRHKVSPDKHTASSEKRRTSDDEHEVPVEQNAASSEQRATSSEQHTTSSERRTTSSEQRTTSSEQRTTSSEQRTTSSDQRTTSSDQRTTSSDQRTTSSEQRTISSEHPTTSSEQRTTSEQPPTSSEQRTSSSEQCKTSAVQHVPFEHHAASSEQRPFSERGSTFSDRLKDPPEQRTESSELATASEQCRASSERHKASSERFRASSERFRASSDQHRTSRGLSNASSGLSNASSGRRKTSPDVLKALSDQYKASTEQRNSSACRQAFPNRSSSPPPSNRDQRRYDHRSREPQPGRPDVRQHHRYPERHHSPLRHMHPERHHSPPRHMRPRSRSPLHRRSPVQNRSVEHARHDALRVSENNLDLITLSPLVKTLNRPSLDRLDQPFDDMMATLRQLVALEDYLGSLGPRVVDLLSEALTMEKQRPNSSEELLEREKVLVLLETAKEKLKGAAQAGLVSGSAAAAVRNAVVRVAATLHEADKRLQRKKQEESSATATKVASVVVGAGEVDRAQIAHQIAVELIAQGKNDVTSEQLAQLVEAVVSMNEAKKRQAEKTNEAEASDATGKAALNKLCGTACALQALQAKYETKDKKSNTQLDLSDSDVETLLKNFHQLSSEEQYNLAAYLKKLEAKEPQRVGFLRQYVNFATTATATPTGSQQDTAVKERRQIAPEASKDYTQTTKEVIHSFTQNDKKKEILKEDIGKPKPEQIYQEKSLESYLKDITKDLASSTDLKALISGVKATLAAPNVPKSESSDPALNSDDFDYFDDLLEDINTGEDTSQPHIPENQPATMKTPQLLLSEALSMQSSNMLPVKHEQERPEQRSPLLNSNAFPITQDSQNTYLNLYNQNLNLQTQQSRPPLEQVRESRDTRSPLIDNRHQWCQAQFSNNNMLNNRGPTISGSGPNNNLFNQGPRSNYMNERGLNNYGIRPQNVNNQFGRFDNQQNNLRGRGRGFHDGSMRGRGRGYY